VDSRNTSDLETLARTLKLLHRYADAAPADLPARVFRGADPTVSRARGPRQEAILALPDMASAAGLRPAVIAVLIDYSVSNTYNLLRSLSRVGLAELVPGSHPQHWRLSSQHRHSAAVFSQLAGTVRAGEWTTCADISIASRGDTSAAWMVCWAAARLPGFPGAHRVLLEGGRAHPSGHDHNRIAPEQIREALAEEGVRFMAQGRAHHIGRVTWDELRERSHA
jgi:hypothetical protein